MTNVNTKQWFVICTDVVHTLVQGLLYSLMDTTEADTHDTKSYKTPGCISTDFNTLETVTKL